ncbi:MAG: translation initiation factor IF-2 [Clostridia bacterium]|nr:translation initiation factor IF-2 [Clostridia bacterium]
MAATKTNKPRIHSVAKELGVNNKELMALLEQYGQGVKNHMSALTEEDMNIIFDYYTQKFDDGTDIGEFLKQEEPAAPEVTEEKPKKSKKKTAKAEQEEAPQEAPSEAAETPTEDADEEIKVRKNRYVDTRSDVVDLEKMDQREKIEEEILDDKLRDQGGAGKQKIKKKNKNKQGGGGSVSKMEQTAAKQKKREKVKIEIPDEITVGEFAEKAGLAPTAVIMKLMELGIMASVSQTIDFDTAQLVGDDLDVIVEKEVIVTDEDILFAEEEDKEEDLKPRYPVVVVMGHVDHGKTSLLDAIRSAHVTDTEAGGITQHIGAYSVPIKDTKITFLDTPGHEAFTAMRARGAQVTDIAVIVVAADDGIMPQTIEAINHAKAAGVSIIIAINKIDRENANVDKVMQALTEYGLIPEEWGGDTVCVKVSAKQKINIDGLLEMITLVADMKELRANPSKAAVGTVIESKLDKGRGPVATVLVQSGTLRTGDIIVAGTSVGRVRAMTNDSGARVREAGPSMPVEITGLSEVCEGGDVFHAVKDERMARSVVEQRKQKIKDQLQKTTAAVSLDDLFNQIKEGEVKDLNIIVKADVMGSVEAVRQSLEKLSNEEVRVRVIHGAVGAVTESDVMLATASNAIIVGFNVRPDSGALAAAKMHKVDMRMYRIIYEAIEEIEAAMKGMLAPTFKETVLGHAEIRSTFKVSGVGTIAGCYIQDGKVQRNASVRVVRDGIVVHEGALSSLKRFKDDVKEVNSGYECGIGLENFNDIKEGDIIECWIMEEVKRD